MFVCVVCVCVLCVVCCVLCVVCCVLCVVCCVLCVVCFVSLCVCVCLWVSVKLSPQKSDGYHIRHSSRGRWGSRRQRRRKYASLLQPDASLEVVGQG